MTKSKEHKDTSVSLHPLTFQEAIAALAQTPKHEESPAEESDSTTEAGPERAPSEKQTAPRPEPSAD